MKIIDQCKKPYPPVKVEEKNIEYAKILLQDYAGQFGEDTAIHLYSYQSFLQEKNWKPYKEQLIKIAEVEMHHLSLLGQTIYLLGIKPIFGTIQCNRDHKEYWTSTYINESIKPMEMIKADIMAEQIAIRNYQLHKEMIEDSYIKALLTRIIEDEKVHLQIFMEMEKEIKKTYPLN